MKVTKRSIERPKEYRMALNSLHETVGFQSDQRIARNLITHIISESFETEQRLLNGPASEDDKRLTISIQGLLHILTKAVMAQSKEEDSLQDESWVLSYPYESSGCVGLRQFERAYGTRYKGYVKSKALTAKNKEVNQKEDLQNSATDDPVEFAFRVLRGAINSLPQKTIKAKLLSSRFKALADQLESFVANTRQSKLVISAFTENNVIQFHLNDATEMRVGKLTINMHLFMQTIESALSAVHAQAATDASDNTVHAPKKRPAEETQSASTQDDEPTPKRQRTDKEPTSASSGGERLTQNRYSFHSLLDAAYLAKEWEAFLTNGVRKHHF